MNPYTFHPMRMCLRCGQDTPHTDSNKDTRCDACGAVRRWSHDLEPDDRYGDHE